ncbi:MAG: [citrate (pro-3S)-lyase] ligase [Lachnospiraceae bacterium]|nr:[citrate (pro-3S)-lyase] ligase [Lachnospiraceae bacterium]
MSEYYISQIDPGDYRGFASVDELLNAEGIRRDANLDYTCAMFDENMRVIATGSCYGNTLRCMAVSSLHQGEGLMNEIVSHLMAVQVSRGNTHVFLYTKCQSADFFSSLGFYEIVRIDKSIVFMENRRTGFADYLQKLSAGRAEAVRAGSGNTLENTSENASGAKIAAVVMNANPFTLGHQYLVEKAASENDILHLFLVSEDSSLIPFEVRKKLVMEGTAHIANICYHDSGPYIISNATFPSYFQKDENAVIESHALLDLTVFEQIAERLGITARYVGEEPTSLVTGIYNQIMQEKLPEKGIRCVVVPRKQCDCSDDIISASAVRRAIQENDLSVLESMLPRTTLEYFFSEESKPVRERIQKAGNVVHY